MKLFVLAFAVLLPQQKNDAESLFKKMEEKLAKAKTVQVKSKGSSMTADGEMSAAVDLSWEAGNKARVASEMKIPGPGEFKSLFISDGKSAALSGLEAKSGKTFQNLTPDLVRAWSRGGGFFASEWIEAATFKDARHPKRGIVPKAVEFKSGPKEKVGPRDAQKLEYTLTEVESGKVSMSLWIDLETHLPLKREMRGFHGREKMTFTEHYSDFKIDEEIDASKFELPKEAK